MDAVRAAITHPAVLVTWVVLVAGSLAWLVHDIRTRNAWLPTLMRAVWFLTVLYSGPIGLALYHRGGRAQIPEDSLGRRGIRSVAHCYSGCGLGEVVGVTLAAGIIAGGTLLVAAVTFTFAYLFGLALTVGPMMAEGVSGREAVRDGVISETASIVVMEVVAIGVDIWLAGEATIGEPLFWASLVVSLSVGLLAAYPVNVLLIRQGVNEGMHDPREMAAAT